MFVRERNVFATVSEWRNVVGRVQIQRKDMVVQLVKSIRMSRERKSKTSDSNILIRKIINCMHINCIQ